MGWNLSHVVFESWRFYLTWLVYIIGTLQIILLLEIDNDCRICDFALFLSDKYQKTGEGDAGE